MQKLGQLGLSTNGNWGISVAVKLFKNPKGNVSKEKRKNITYVIINLDIPLGIEKEFINEVATICRIHYVILVRLVEFCNEGTWLALVYEFMPKGSTNKFIFSEEGERFQNRPLSWERLQKIVPGCKKSCHWLLMRQNIWTRGASRATKGSFIYTT